MYWRKDLAREIADRHPVTTKCPTCTLPLPCFEHCDERRTVLLHAERRKKYFRNKDAALCDHYSFMDYCPSFEKNGRCQYAHPLKNIPLPEGRCDVCTLPYSSATCIIHRPPLGKPLVPEDTEHATVGGEVRELFKIGEIVGYNSALERTLIYAIIVDRDDSKRSYELCTEVNAVKTFQATHTKLYRKSKYSSSFSLPSLPMISTSNRIVCLIHNTGIRGYTSKNWELSFPKLLKRKAAAAGKITSAKAGKLLEAATDPRKVDWGSIMFATVTNEKEQSVDKTTRKRRGSVRR